MSSLDIPIDFNVSLLPNSPNTHGVLGSKSVGEPPLILSSGVVSAVRAAVCAFLEETGDASDFCALQAPCTVERIQLAAKEAVANPMETSVDVEGAVSGVGEEKAAV